MITRRAEVTTWIGGSRPERSVMPWREAVALAFEVARFHRADGDTIRFSRRTVPGFGRREVFVEVFDVTTGERTYRLRVVPMTRFNLGGK